MAGGEVQYGIKCPVCGTTVFTNSLSSRVPNHPPKGQGQSAVSCKASGINGIVSGTRAKPTDDPIT